MEGYVNEDDRAAATATYILPHVSLIALLC